MNHPVHDPVRVPLLGTLLVEASAGTGKTWTIGALVLRFLLEEGLELPSLLVLTFTEAATAELRDRLRQRLEEARRALEANGPPADPFLEELRAHLRAAGRWDDARALRQLRMALMSFDEASIFTIHGFCKRVLSERAVALGLPAELELGEDSVDSLRQVGLDELRRLWQAFPPGLLDWLRSQGGLLDPGPWLHLAELGRRHPGPALPPVNLDAPLAGLPELEHRHAESARWALATLLAVGIEDLAGLIAASSLNKNSYRPASVTKWLGWIRDWLELGATPQGCPDARRFTPAILSTKLTKGGTCPQHPVFEALAALLELDDQVGAAYTSVLEQLQHAALRDWPAAAARLRLESRRLDFSDLLSLVAEGLAGPGGAELARALGRRWRAALVDEFQDTDPLQAGIFQRVFQAEGLPLILVGDPKQSIYSFRGADLHAYLAAARAAGRREELRTNWRSGAGLLRAVNALFDAGRFPAQRGAFLRPDIHAAELQPSGQVVERELWLDGRALPPFRVLQEDVPDLNRPLAGRRVARHLARLLARLLRPASGQRTGWLGPDGLVPVEGRDVAVLVRSHRQGTLVADALAELGLACVQLSPRSVLQSLEAVDLQRLLLALARPHDTRRLRTVLAGPLALALGSDPQAALGSAPLQEELQERLHAALQTARRLGSSRALRGLFEELGLPEALLGLRRGERRLTNWLQLLELLPGLEGPGGLTPDELALRLEWSRDQESAAAELRLESEDNLVRVLTLHKSKGLEFPLVVCPFLWDESGRRDEFGATLLHDGEERPELVAWSKARPLSDARRAARQEEELAESLRLAYVGLTRARHHTLLYSVAPSPASRRRPSALDWLLLARRLPEDAPGAGESWRPLWAEGPGPQRWAWEELARPGVLGVEALELPPAPATGDTRSTAAEPPRIRPFTGRILAGARLSSFSSLLTDAHADERLDEWFAGAAPAAEPAPGEPEDWRGRFPRGATAGTCLHKLLELVDFNPGRGSAQLENHCRRQLRAHGLDEALAPGTARWLEEILDTPLTARGFRLSALGDGQRVSELEFHLCAAPLPAAEFRALLERHGLFSATRLGLAPPWPASPPPLPGDLPAGFLKGYIDQIHCQDGRWWVLDWKSNRLGATAAAYPRRALADEMARSGYFIQGLFYLVALHRHLARTLPGYQPGEHLGGLRYLFLRGVQAEHPGQGCFEDRPPLELILELDGRLGASRD
ncbi:MAG: UvrD-helicase domain-containing protein [Candidatus Delongbacteria bacterium]